MIENGDVTATIKTFMRPDKFEKCLRATINAGITKVVVGYDGPDQLWGEHNDICTFYSDSAEIKIRKYPFNCGISKVRNEMLKLVDTMFLMQLDDDNYIPSNTLDIVPFLKNHDTIGAVALGWVFPNAWLQIDAYDIEIVDRYFLRTSKGDKKISYYEGLAYAYPFDFIPNCAMFKKEVFDNALWDEQFIISGEHEDFYLQLLDTKWEFAVCTSLYAYHDWLSKPASEFVKYRRGHENKKSYLHLMEKWNLRGITPPRHLSMFLFSVGRGHFLADKTTREKIQHDRLEAGDMIKF